MKKVIKLLALQLVDIFNFSIAATRVYKPLTNRRHFVKYSISVSCANVLRTASPTEVQ